jgi:hypothetical protein
MEEKKTTGKEKPKKDFFEELEDLKKKKAEMEEKIKKAGYIKAEEKKEEKKEEEKAKPTSSKAQSWPVNFWNIVAIVFIIFGLILATIYIANSCKTDDKISNENVTANEAKAQDIISNENVATEQAIDKEIENNLKGEIERNRSYDFSQLILSFSPSPDAVERDGITYWAINTSPGEIVVTSPGGSGNPENPHMEQVTILAYPNDMQIVDEWNILKIKANLPALAFWLDGDSTGGDIKIEYLDKNGNAVKTLEGEFVVNQWQDKSGKAQQALQFKDNLSNETRPACFEIAQIQFDADNAISVSYPYDTIRISITSVPGSRLAFKTGPTMRFGSGEIEDAGFGFYLW